MFSENQKSFDIKREISEILPEQFKGRKPSEVYITTYSLEIEVLNEILYSLGAIPFNNTKINVYYDKYSRKTAIPENNVVSEKNLHAIDMGEKAFHPKIILLKYKEENKEEYVIFVMSKNISDSSLLDAYSVAYGEVSDKEQSNGKYNGKYVFDFFEGFDKKFSADNLKRVNFVQDNKSVKFINAEDIYNEIKDKNGLIIISPFLSQKVVENLKDNIALLVSTDSGFSKISSILDDDFIKKCRVILTDDSDFNALHAKIYCWKENNETKCIIGSSNATNNGLGLCKNDCNKEFNMEFSIDNEEYDNLRNLFKSELKKEDLEYLYTEDTDDFNPKSILVGLDIECKKENDKYICELNLDKNKKYGDYSVQISLDNVNFDKIIESDKPFSTIIIRVSKDEQSRDFAISVYDKWEETEVQEELDEQSQKNYKELLKRIKNNIINRKNVSSGITVKNAENKEQSKKNTVRKAINRNRNYEDLMTLSANYQGDEFEKKLKELQSVLIEINDDDSKELKEMINKILGEEKNERN